jgi:hypothetical protein
LNAEKKSTLSRHFLGLIFASFDDEGLKEFYEQFRRKLFDLK